jgi:tRNA pseudouridine synthase 10
LEYYIIYPARASLLKLNLKKKSMNLDKIIDILKDGYVCDRCIGRQFAQLLTGTDNKKRGEAIRFILAMKMDSGEDLKINESNLYGFEFHNKKLKAERPKKCSVCNDIIDNLKKKVKEIENELKGYEFNTILIGSKIPDDLLFKEQDIWDTIGIDFCESLKSEVNRELGKLVCEKLGKDVDKSNPEINIIYDFKNSKIEKKIKSLFIEGKYSKLVRGIPQTEWKEKIFKISVQGIIERPLLKTAKSEESSFHGAGREDIDAKCLGWRPFVIELKSPIKRKFDLKKVEKEINKSKKVKVKGLKFTKKSTIRDIKSARYDKKYRLEVDFEKKLENLENINELNGAIISQKTPTRVLRRRANKIRRRKVKHIKYKVLGENKLEIEVKTEAGLYVKELVSGDDGRTVPSLSDLIKNKVKSIKLDVIKVYCD